MIHREARGLGYYAGSHWFLGWLALGLIAAASLWLFSALRVAQAIAEKMVVELTVQSMRTGLKVAMGEAVISMRDSEISGWVGCNPIRWLEMPPVGYTGDCQAGGKVAEGGWCFEPSSGDLVYRPRNEHALERIQNDGSDGPLLLRWRVVKVGKDTPGDSGFTGLRVENVTPYRWEVE